MKSQDELILFAREALELLPSVQAELIPLSKRGSDRIYFRLKWPPTNSAILVWYQISRVENCYFADIAAFLDGIGIPVPKILRHDAAGNCILMEDLGDTDLWSLRHASWETRRELYQKTLIAAHRLHSFAPQNFPSLNVRVMEAFGPDLYQWERAYFKENFVEALCGIHLDSMSGQRLEAELCGLSKRLESHSACLVHRDLQSQNVMIYRDEPFLIDFQGMRFGSRFYDLGSLLCDPYVEFKESERMELLSFYYEQSHTNQEWSHFQAEFWNGSVQRLLQALGCYGYLGLTKGFGDYLTHVPSGFRNLRLAAENAGGFPVLLEICERCERTIRDSKFKIRD